MKKLCAAAVVVAMACGVAKAADLETLRGFSELKNMDVAYASNNANIAYASNNANVGYAIAVAVPVATPVLQEQSKVITYKSVNFEDPMQTWQKAWEYEKMLRTAGYKIINTTVVDEDFYGTRYYRFVIEMEKISGTEKAALAGEIRSYESPLYVSAELAREKMDIHLESLKLAGYKVINWGMDTRDFYGAIHWYYTLQFQMPAK